MIITKKRILLTCILKDDTDIDIVSRMLKSFMPYCSGLAVAITGLSETIKLKNLVKSYDGKYVETRPTSHPKIYTKINNEYIFTNFAEARNVSFALADEMNKEKAFDWYTWADSDDILFGGEELLDVAEKATEVDSVFFTYWYAVNTDKDGNITDVVIEHLRERLIKPNVFKWISRLHEVTVPIDGNYKAKHTQYELNIKENRKCVWAHITDLDRVDSAIDRNITILEIQIREEERKDPRTLFYLAKTYYDMKKSEYDTLSMELLKEYMELSGWAEERSNAMEYMGNIYARGGNHQEAIKAYYGAVQQYPMRHMPYLLLAKEHADLGLTEESNFWLDVVLRMEEPKTRTTIGNPLEVKVLSASLKYNDAIKHQRIDEAISWIKIRNKLLNIDDDSLLKSLEEIKEMNEAAKAVFMYSKWLKNKGYINKIQHLLKSLPLDLGREPFAHYISNEINIPKVWTDKEICFYASWGAEHFEKWSAKSLNDGIGGSETAVIELARQWAKNGYKVTVYGDPREDEGEYDGVMYRPFYEINWNDTFNILILWRSPHLLDKEIKANKIFMDLHDIASSLDWTPSRIEKVTKVFFKTNYHRDMVPKLPNEKVVVISNGI